MNFNFLLFKTFSLFISLLPLFIVKWIMKVLAKLFLILFKKYRNYIYNNIDFVFNNSKSNKEKEELTFKTVYYSFLSFYHFSCLNFKKTNLFNDIKIIGEENLIDYHNKQNGCIIASAHIGCWELFTYHFQTKIDKIWCVGRPLKNEQLNKYLFDTREQYGSKTLFKQNSAKGITKVLKNNESIALLVDQNTNLKNGYECKFLGKKSICFNTVGRFSSKNKNIILPAFYIYEDDKIKLIIKEVIKPEDYNYNSDLINNKINEVISDIIFKYPESWLWVHKRFKHFNPELYK